MDAIITEIQNRSQSLEEDVDEAMEASEHIAAAGDDNGEDEINIEDEGAVTNGISSINLIAAISIILMAIMMNLSFL